MAETRIQLCGTLVVSVGGRRIEGDLPGRQGRVLFAYLVLNRHRPASRAEVVDALWEEAPPPGADRALSALLSKLRPLLEPGCLAGRHELRLELPDGARIDVEAASEALHRAESAVALGDYAASWGPARVALHTCTRVFLVGHEGSWIDAERRRLGELRLRSLECIADAGLALGGPELASTERSAHALIAAVPLRESGYRYLMEALTSRGNVAEALVTYERLRQLLRDELGVPPSAATQELHRRLLSGPSSRA